MIKNTIFFKHFPLIHYYKIKIIIFPVPKEPDKDTVLSVNSTSVTLTFGSWPTQMCSIHSFTCQYAANGRGGAWVKFPRQKLIGGDTFTVGQLQPATVYTVRVVVHTEAGDTSWEHRFATRTKTGGKRPTIGSGDRCLSSSAGAWCAATILNKNNTPSAPIYFHRRKHRDPAIPYEISAHAT